MGAPWAALRRKRPLLLLPLGVLALGRLATKAEKGTVTLLASSSGFFVVFLAMESLALSLCCLVALPKSFGSPGAAQKPGKGAATPLVFSAPLFFVRGHAAAYRALGRLFCTRPGAPLVTRPL